MNEPRRPAKPSPLAYCAVAGRAKFLSWTKDGEEKHGLSVVADKVLTVYAAGKARKAAREQPEEIAA